MDAAQIVSLITYVLGKLVGIIGLLALGLAAAWLLLAALKKSENPWMFMLGIYAVFFLFAAVVIWSQPPALVGAYAFGNGIGLLVWGRGKKTTGEPPEEPGKTAE